MTELENLRLLRSSSSTMTRVSRSQFRTLIKLADSWVGDTNDCYHWTQHVTPRKIGQIFMLRGCYAPCKNRLRHQKLRIIFRLRLWTGPSQVSSICESLASSLRFISKGKAAQVEFQVSSWRIRRLWKSLQGISDLRHWSSKSGDQSRCKQVLAIRQSALLTTLKNQTSTLTCLR